MNFGFLDGGTAGHEFGHAIGLGMSTRTRVSGIQWNEAQVLKDLAGPPEFLDAGPDPAQRPGKYSVDQVNGTAFDPKSIMLYFLPASWTLNGVATGRTRCCPPPTRASSVALLPYPKSPVATTGAHGERTTTYPAAIGKAGESDLYSFVVTTGGRHIIATHGPTDVLMSLFGPAARRTSSPPTTTAASS